MSARKIVYLDQNYQQPRNDNNISHLQTGTVIERRDFKFWAQMPKKAKRVHGVMKADEVNQMIQSLSERVSVLKWSYEKGRTNEVVTLSARISVIASQLGLPRTANLASQIGEAQMLDDHETVGRLVRKLDDLIESLFHDISC